MTPTQLGQLIRIADRLGQVARGSLEADQPIHDALGRAGPVLPYTAETGAAAQLIPPGGSATCPEVLQQEVGLQRADAVEPGTRVPQLAEVAAPCLQLHYLLQPMESARGPGRGVAAVGKWPAGATIMG